MQLPSQSICKLLWYQPITEENRGDHVRHHSQDTHEYYVYTERMLPVASAVWSKDKIINILQAFDLLLTEYGCFRISEKMICQNEKKELRLWINEQPARNRP